MMIIFLFSDGHTQYTDQIQQQFDSVDINLSAITVLSPEIKNQLSNFSAKTDSFDSAAITQQVGPLSPHRGTVTRSC